MSVVLETDIFIYAGEAVHGRRHIRRDKESKMSGKKFLSAAVVAILAATPAAAQVGRYFPENPKWDENLSIVYDPAAPGAALPAGEGIYAFIVFWSPDAFSSRWLKLEARQGGFGGEVAVPRGAGFVQVSFMSMDGWDAKAGLNLMIYRPDGIPAEGAWQRRMISPIDESAYLEAFQNERRLYPGNVSVYKEKWWLEQFIKKDRLKDIVKADLESLAAGLREETDRLLFALAYGRFLLDDEAGSREAIRRLVRTYPDSHLTASALIDYEYHVFVKNIGGEGPAEVKRLVAELFVRNPESRSLRNVFQRMILGEEIVTLDRLRTFLGTWTLDEPENPAPHYLLASRGPDKGLGLPEAAAAIRRALELLLIGKSKLYGDVTGKLMPGDTVLYFETAADIFARMGDLPSSLAAVKAAQTLGKDSSAASFLREADIWRQCGSLKKAEQALREARRRGAEGAENELRVLYEQRMGTAEGFKAWLDENRTAAPAGGSSPSPSAKKSAPDFEVETLDGRTLRLSEFRGKVVVLNFWFIGCGPCRVEIPSLNKLVAEFGDRGAVFVAFALDPADRLPSFLKDIPFRYQIVPDASALVKSFGVELFPTHVLIDKEGRIEYFLTGGSADRDKDLRVMIEQLLKRG